jgi:[acyl-carrier-protein] S-malonyltransferase
MTERAVLACPGRGSYSSISLGSLPDNHPWVVRAEQLRAEYKLEPLLSLDRAPRFDPSRHLQPVHASPLIFLVSLIDAEAAAHDYEITAVLGNSLGWYTALAVNGALAFEDAFRLVQEMAILQQEPLPSGGPGGQVIYPLTDAAWRPDPRLRAAISAVLDAPSSNGDGHVHESIDLGGYAVLAGDEAGVARLLGGLTPVKVGERLFPLRLALHGPYHTPLVAHVAEAARERLGDLGWRAPSATLIDGRGARWTPWSTDPAELRDYTLGQQVTSPYRFALSVRVALREEAPDVLLLPGPGNSLGGICGQLVVAEGYRGVRSREEFEAAQRSEAPIVLSMRR